MLAIGRKLGGRYTILGVLGRGGMGAVYKAWDDELSLPVAIKTIYFSEGTDPGTRGDMERRFKREVTLARQITHRSVVRIHDIGDIDGMKYLTMELVEGETLAAMMRRLGPMPVRDVMNVARQVADGLVAAHEKGVIHRDLKPENIMVTPGGHALITDFGIARSARTTTHSAVISGTLEYMSPEQSKSAGVDSRTDIYSLGLVLYDMLTGRQRMHGHDSPMSELVVRLQQSPSPVSTLRPDVPTPLAAVVQKAIQTNPDDRFADAQAMVDALATIANDGHTRRDSASAFGAPIVQASSRRWTIPAAAIVLIVAGAGGGWYWSQHMPAVLQTPPSPIAVIFANFDNKTNDPMFDGLLEQALSVGVESASFINAFPRPNALRLAAQFPDKTLTENTARLIALREGMGAVVGGVFESKDGGYRLSVHVVKPDVSDVTFEASETASSKADVLNAVGKLAAKIRIKLGDATANPAQLAPSETFTANSLEAAAEYVKGQMLLGEGKPEAALDAYKKATTLDPDLGRAWSGMGAVATNLRRRDDAEQYYKMALSKIDRMTERERFRTRGSYYAAMGSTDAARDENEALVARFPADAVGLSNLAFAYFDMWNLPRALELGKQAAAIFPGNVLRQSNVALYAFYASDFKAAGAQAAKVLTLNKDYPRGHLVLALSELVSGNTDRASEEYQVMSTLPAPGPELSVHGVADLARYQGRMNDAAAAIAARLTTETGVTARARFISTLASIRIAQNQGAEARKIMTSINLTGADPATLARAAEVYIVTGRAKDAEVIADGLAQRVGAGPLAFAAVLRAQLALASGNAAAAQQMLSEQRRSADGWWLRFWLGRAELAMGLFAQADSEFDACLRRKGEAAAVFMDDYPTYSRLIDVHYYQGLAREGLKSPGAAESFKTFLDAKANGDGTDGLVADARKRVTAR
jgi:serine/threonine protein kinase/tetratricopeptide (TPR) repeat protein